MADLTFDWDGSNVMGMFKKRNHPVSGGATDQYVPPPYDHAKEGDLAADGDVAGLRVHMRDHPKRGHGVMTPVNYEDAFHISERVAEAVLHETLNEVGWKISASISIEIEERVSDAVRGLAKEHEFVMDKMIHDEVEYQMEQCVQDFMDEMEAGARTAVQIGLEDNDCICKGDN